MQAATKEQAHYLIDRIDPSEIPAAIELLQQLLDPVTLALANAPYEDEEISDEEEEAVARAKLETTPPTSMEDVLAEYGLTIEELRSMDLPPMETSAKSS